LQTGQKWHAAVQQDQQGNYRPSISSGRFLTTTKRGKLKVTLKEFLATYYRVSIPAISRSRAAEPRPEKQLGGVKRLSDVARSWRAAQGSHACVTK